MKNIPTNPDGSPLDAVTFFRIAHYGPTTKHLEVWNGFDWCGTDVAGRWMWSTVPELVGEVERTYFRIEVRWGQSVNRDPISNAEQSHTSHLPAGDRIGAVGIERINGGSSFEVHLWNGFGWINVGPTSFTSNEDAIAFARELTGKFDEASSGGICENGHDFRCRRCGVTRSTPIALTGEHPATVAAIMDGAFQIMPTPVGVAVERYRTASDHWTIHLDECEPELWPQRHFASQIEAEIAILNYGRRVGEYVTLIRKDGAEIVTAAPGVATFPRHEEMQGTVLTDIMEASVIASPTTAPTLPRQYAPAPVNVEYVDLPSEGNMPEHDGTYRVVPHFENGQTIVTSWTVQRWSSNATAWIACHGPDWTPPKTYWEAVERIANNTANYNTPSRLVRPTADVLERWASRGALIDPPVIIPVTPEIGTKNIVRDDHGMYAVDEWTATGWNRITDDLSWEEAEEYTRPKSTVVIETGKCEIRAGSMPGDCWDVFTWTGHTWKKIAGNVTKRTAEGVVRARSLDPETPKPVVNKIEDVRADLETIRSILEHGKISPDNWKTINDIVIQALERINEK